MGDHDKLRAPGEFLQDDAEALYIGLIKCGVYFIKYTERRRFDLKDSEDQRYRRHRFLAPRQ